MFTLNCNGRLLVIEKPVVMGIINVTPDSFYSGSRISSIEQAIFTAEKMMHEGATILDIGGQSTRPGSQDVGIDTELKRVIPAIEAVSKEFPESYISIDTYHAKVALEAVKAGACIVNDISGGQIDNQMITSIAGLQVPYIAMHIKGTPVTMQQHAQYEDVALEVLDFFISKVEECRLAGINDLILDPGFGFAKTSAHNFSLLQKLSVLKMLNKPILAGLSRKATVYKTLGITPEEALNGTTVLHTIALQNGATILRVHDVKEAVEAILLLEALRSNNE